MAVNERRQELLKRAGVAWATCGSCHERIYLGQFADVAWEPDYNPNEDPKVWRHETTGYAACSNITTFAIPAAKPHPSQVFGGTQPIGRGRPFTNQRRTVLQSMASAVAQVNRDNGWYDEDVSVGDMCALLHSEVSEAFDAWRKHGFDDQTPAALLDPVQARAGKDRLPKPEGYGSELADVLIRLLDQCTRHGVDLAGEFERKLAYNRTREYRHGGRRV